MTLDRQSIEKRDFPIARRGYDPAGVDAHLARIADELDQMRREGDRAATGGVAGNASTHVQQIVEAAESTAEQLLRDAQTEAGELRERAAGDAQRSRHEALEESREHVAKVSEATARMMQRVEAMDAELGSLVDGLRTGVNRLVADLALLEGNIADLHEQHGGVAPVAPRTPSAAHGHTREAGSLHGETVAIDEEPTPSPATDAEVVATDLVGATGVDDGESWSAGDDMAVESELSYGGPGGDGSPGSPVDTPGRALTAEDRDRQASARIVALDLALGGADRETIKHELDATFGYVDGVDQMLDEVFTSIDA